MGGAKSEVMYLSLVTQFVDDQIFVGNAWKSPFPLCSRSQVANNDACSAALQPYPVEKGGRPVALRHTLSGALLFSRRSTCA